VENQLCVDCSTPLAMSSSTWATVTFGAFMCIKCAGVHRKMGVKTSRIKSVHMDVWSDEECQGILEKGNRVVNLMYEKFTSQDVKKVVTSVLLKSSSNNNDGDDTDDDKSNNVNENRLREEWIRSKYEKKCFLTEDGLRVQLCAAKTIEGSIRPPEKTSTTVSSSSSSKSMSTSVVEIAKRFVNYFVVVGRGSTFIPPKQIPRKDNGGGSGGTCI
jgi:hypothetical protein